MDPIVKNPLKSPTKNKQSIHPYNNYLQTDKEPSASSLRCVRHQGRSGEASASAKLGAKAFSMETRTKPLPFLGGPGVMAGLILFKNMLVLGGSGVPSRELISPGGLLPLRGHLVSFSPLAGLLLVSRSPGSLLVLVLVVLLAELGVNSGNTQVTASCGLCNSHECDSGRDFLILMACFWCRRSLFGDLRWAHIHIYILWLYRVL